MKFLLAIVFLLCGCSTKTMNGESYACVDIGITEKKLYSCYGSPFSCCNKDDGTKVLEYIERFSEYKRKVAQVNYYFTIKNGVVIHKCRKTSYAPGYMYDSLDYQSQNNKGEKAADDREAY